MAPQSAHLRKDKSMNNARMASSALVSVGAIFAVANDASTTLEQRIEALETEIADLTEESEGIVNTADEEGRDLSDEELTRVGELTAQIEAKNKQVTTRKAILASRSNSNPGRRTASEPGAPSNGPTVQVVQPRVNGARGGFKSFGEFAVNVRGAATNPAGMDRRLQAAATTYGSEGTGADGGFAVPPEFRREIWQKTLGEENLLTRCDNLVTGANSITIPKDETTPWQSTGGIQVYWEAEAAQATASKPALEMSTVRLNKLMALVPVTDELLEDAPGLDSWLRAKAPQKMASKINTAIIRGTGAGQPLGILNAGSVISQAAEGGQTADTVWAANVTKMWSRLYAPCRRNAVWLINQDVEPQLDMMAFDPSADSLTPVYLPVGGLSSSGYSTLKGRPVVPVEACSTIGDVGDIILVDLTQYLALTKGSDIKTDVSMHLYFDQGLQAYRFTFRVNGQPWWGNSITPQFGNATRSWAVTLAAR